MGLAGETAFWDLLHFHTQNTHSFQKYFHSVWVLGGDGGEGWSSLAFYT